MPVLRSCRRAAGYGMLQRPRGVALVPYHLGRMTTCVARHPGFRAVVALMPGLAALAMIAQAVGGGLPGVAWVKGLLARRLLAMALRIVT